MRQAEFVLVIGAAFFCASAGTSAHSPSAPAPIAAKSATLSPLAAFQLRDARLQTLGWKLARANAAYCDDAPLSIGLQLQDMAGFRSPDSARQALGLSGEFAVQTAANGSPAHDAGIAPNAEVTHIDDAALNDWPAKEALDWERLKRAHDAIDASLAENGEVRLTFANGNAITVEGVPACATRFELLSGGKKALAEGARVQFGSEFPGFAYPEDEFAAVIAHELAHNLLQHRKWLDAKGRKRRHVRVTEREADRMMPWLIANAGYDPMAAVRFMKRWGPKHSKGIFRARTHEGWDERAENIEAEARIVQAQLEEHGKADWSRHFERAIEPLRPY